MKSFITNYFRALGSYWPTAKALSGSRAGALALFFVLLSIPVRKRLFGRKPTCLLIIIAGERLNFFVRDGLDIAVLREMFVDKEYTFSEAAAYKPTHIADIGAHIGAATLFLRSRYPGAKITAYEPEPQNFALLQKNVSHLKGVACVHAAVAGHSGGVTLYPHVGGSTRNSLKRDPDSRGEIQVPSVRFEEVVAQGVDCVKFDVEGAEYDLFAAAPRRVLEQVGIYMGEYHQSLTGKTPQEFARLFEGFIIVWHQSLLVIVKN